MRSILRFEIIAFLCLAVHGCVGGDAASAGGGAAPRETGNTDRSTAPEAGRGPGDTGDPPGYDATAPDPTVDAADAAAPSTAAECFRDLRGAVTGPDYDQFHPILRPSCAGTHHQAIAGVQRLVFVGDSVTEGTPPNLPTQIYRTLVTEDVVKRFGTPEVADCAKWGAKMRDLLSDGNGQQLQKCFPTAPDSRRTLVVMTMGGNDISGWAKDGLDTAAASAQADVSAAYLKDAMAWLKDPVRFPGGVDVVLTNVYEYTDTSGDLLSCPAASLAGFKSNWPQGAPAIVHFQEQIMKVVVDAKADMVFLLEHFCGHGYRRADPTLQCYRGPNAELWFDLTCIHPNPTGHAQIADLFGLVIHG